jgi:hypothetical protein
VRKRLIGILLSLVLVVLAQQELFSPDFGPYEGLRQQAHAQCQGYLAQGFEAYAYCLVQLAIGCSSRDFASFMACTAAVTAGYPAPGSPVLKAQRYVVEIAGGVTRERDPNTNQVRREARVGPALFYTLERASNGNYRGVVYGSGGQPQFAFWVSPACESLGRDGRPATDLLPCPLFPGKPYLLDLVSSPIKDFLGMDLPNPVFYKGGRLQDDFDGDGKAELGYMKVTGGGGRAGGSWEAGGVEAFGYDPETGFLKYHYTFFFNIREGGGPALNFIQERLILFRVTVR